MRNLSLKEISQKLPRGWQWIAAAVVAVLLRMLLPAAVIEEYYYGAIFKGIRWLFDYTAGRLPFPAVYLLTLTLLIMLVRFFLRLRRERGSFGRKVGRFLWSATVFTAGAVFFFLVLWGYNYGRISVEEKLNFDPQPLTYEELQAEFARTTEELIAARAAVPGATDSVLSPAYFPENAEDLIRADLTEWLRKHRYPTPGRVRGRLLHPQGILLSISTAGVYLPWVGEGHIDAGMYPIQWPFVTAHEMSHAYGFTDEGTCNFIAYLALRDSENAFFRYSAVLGYWVYLASGTARYDYDAYQEFYQTLPLGIRNDRKYIRAYADRFPDLMPRLRDAFYNQYLKTQGIEEGIKNYSRVIMLVRAWRKRKQEAE